MHNNVKYPQHLIWTLSHIETQKYALIGQTYCKGLIVFNEVEGLVNSRLHSPVAKFI
jgi:hypothetical protein